jgi:hypothetical protein
VGVIVAVVQLITTIYLLLRDLLPLLYHQPDEVVVEEEVVLTSEMVDKLLSSGRNSSNPLLPTQPRKP